MVKVEHEERRVIGVFDGVCLVVGLVIGVGIYQTPPLIAGSVPSETALYTVWIIGALLTIAGALTYIELATTFPEDGGDYQFLRRAFGPKVGYVYAWSQIFLIRPGAIAAVAFPCAEYIKNGFPVLTSVMSEPILAAALILALSLVNICGTLHGVFTQNVLSVLAYGLLLVFALAGAFFVGDSGLASHANEQTPNFGLALILVLFCFGGWSELALVAGEVSKPTKNFRVSMLVGIGLVTALYCLINYTFCRAIGFVALATTEAPASHVFYNLPSAVVACLVALACLSSLNALILAGSRISFAFGEDSRLFKFLGAWSGQYNGPTVSIALQGGLAIAIALLAGSFSSVLVYTTAVVWLFYFLSGLSLFSLRRRFPDVERPKPVWGYPFTPLVFCASCLYLVYSAFEYDLRGSLITFGFALLGVAVFHLEQRFSTGRSA